MAHLAQTRVSKPQKQNDLRFDNEGQVVRAEARLRTRLREGWVSDFARRLKIECLFMDISPHGARLRLSRPAPLPVQILVFDERSQAAYKAEVRWQRANEVGVLIPGGTSGLKPQ